MKKIIKKILVLSISLCMISSIFAIKVNALDTSNDECGDVLGSDTIVTTMDENGNVLPINEIEVNTITTAPVGVSARASSRIVSTSNAVVNFRIYSSSSINTSYLEVGTNREGYTNGYYGADGAFLGYDNDNNPTKVKFMQAGVVGWVDVNKVQVLNYSDASVNILSKYYVKNGHLYHGIVTNMQSSSYGSSIDYGSTPSFLKEGMSYYSYDGHYFYEGDNAESYAKMLNDYRNETRSNSVNSTNPYYNYYQYLSHRSTTNYTAQEIDSAINAMVSASEKSYGRTSKLRNTGSSFISNQNTYGTNALLMLAVAVNESAWGCSSIAASKNNLFGHSAYDSDPNGSANSYSSVDYSIYYHSAIFISKGYLDPITDSRYYGANVGDKASGINVKYASDPYWGEKAAAIYWKIDNYLGNKDKDKYTIAIKDTISNKHSVVEIKSSGSSSSTTLYSTYPVSSKTTYKGYAPTSYAFIITDETGTNNYYKIQSDGEVNSSRNKILVQSAYSFTNSYAYIPKSSVTIVNKGNSQVEVPPVNNVDTENTVGQSSGKAATEPTISYQANSQNVGWLGEVNEPNTAGTTGRSLDLYQLKIKLANTTVSANLSGSINVNGSWVDYDKITENTVIGNSGQKIEQVKFDLTNQSGYRLMYRVHSSNIGWMEWVNAGNVAGVLGNSIQAIEFKLVSDSTIKATPSIYYQAHIKNEGWLTNAINEEIAGTTGKSLGLQAIKIGIDNLSNYQLTVKTYDSVNKWKTYTNVDANTVIGTTGLDLSLQAISATLTNEEGYIIEYRTHVSNIGWSDWTSDGNISGVTSGNEQIEAVMFRVVESPVPTKITMNKTELNLYRNTSETLKATLTPTNVENNTITWTSDNSYVATVSSSGVVTAKNAGSTTITATTVNGKKATCKVTVTNQVPTISYQTHIQDIGWQEVKKDSETSGTTGLSKQIEAIKITLENNVSYSGSITYRVHVKNDGWQAWTSEGNIAGTTGASKQVEAVEIKLSGEIASYYDVYYRSHVGNVGWMPWCKNGETSGTTGYGYRMEAIEIKLVKK